MSNKIQDVLGLEQEGRRHWQSYLPYLGVGLLLVILLIWWLWPSGTIGDIRYTTDEVAKGDLTVQVTATGVLQPLNQVDVGTEISGTVEKVEADFNDHVTKGQILAVLDTEQLSARLRQSQANLALAKASVKEADATLLETRSKLKRTKEMSHKKLVSPEDVDTAQAAYERAVAGLERTKAQVTQAQAQLDSDRSSLDKAVIRSPINGIVLKRQIEPGQTVAASLQTPVLFTLAENLAQMELDVAVDEADVGMVKEKQYAVFKVDAYPNRSFPAQISQVRFAPQTVDGVVTYETVLSVNNEDLSLRPGMTATAEITVQQLKDVLLIPNAALRFTPPRNVEKKQRTLLTALLPRHPGNNTKQVVSDEGSTDQRRIWILRDGKAVAIQVRTGATDGRLTQVTGGKLEAGMAIITDATYISK